MYMIEVSGNDTKAMQYATGAKKMAAEKDHRE
jgi:hypothetical protein